MSKGLFSLLLLCLPPAVMAADRFVDSSLPAACSSGSYNVTNRNCSGSDGTGYKSLQSAIDDARPGDRIYLRSGTYTQAVIITKRGTASAPITIAAYAAERPILDGRGSQPSYSGGLIE